MKTHYYIIFLLIIQPIVLLGQENEFKSWSAIEYRLEIDKKWQVDFSQHLRLKENLDAIDNYFTQSEVTFKVAHRCMNSCTIGGILVLKHILSISQVRTSPLIPTGDIGVLQVEAPEVSLEDLSKVRS